MKDVRSDSKQLASRIGKLRGGGKSSGGGRVTPRQGRHLSLDLQLTARVPSFLMTLSPSKQKIALIDGWLPLLYVKKFKGGKLQQRSPKLET